MRRGGARAFGRGEAQRGRYCDRGLFVQRDHGPAHRQRLQHGRCARGGAGAFGGVRPGGRLRGRAVVIERAARPQDSEIVSVLPQPHAGGSFATALWQALRDPVAVETIRADAGMDIGDTLIGMHLKRVAVPVRLPVRTIGCARLVCARTRPKFIGGARAVYQPEEELR